MLVICGRSSIRPRNVPPAAAIEDVRQRLDSNRPVCIRLNYRFLLHATRPADADREIRTLLGDVEPAEVLPSHTREAFRYCLAEYNPLVQFGGAPAGQLLR